MTLNSSHQWWPDLLAELGQPGVHWQLMVLAVCLALAWGLARLLTWGFASARERHARLPVPIDSFQMVLTPLLMVLLIALSVLVLGRWMPVGMLRLALPLLLSFLLIRSGFFLLRKAFARQGKASSLLQAFEWVFAVVVWIGLALYITGLWPDIVDFLDDTTVPVGRHRESLMVILQAVLSVAVTLFVALWASSALEQRLMRFDTVHSSMRAVLARTGRAAFILVAVLVSLSLVGIDLTVLSVFGGALGVGIGLGLQKLVSSYVSGFVVLLERSLSIGDIVTVDRYSGQVVKINTRYTVLKGTDGAEAVIPNELLVSATVQNFCLSDRLQRLSSLVIVGYETDLEPLFAEIERVVAPIPRVLSNPAPAVQLTRFAIEGLELEVSFWIDDPENGRIPVVAAVNRAVWRLLHARRVRMPGQRNTEPPVTEETDKSLIAKPLSENDAADSGSEA